MLTSIRNVKLYKMRKFIVYHHCLYFISNKKLRIFSWSASSPLYSGKSSDNLIGFLFLFVFIVQSLAISSIAFLLFSIAQNLAGADPKNPEAQASSNPLFPSPPPPPPLPTHTHTHTYKKVIFVEILLYSILEAFGTKR